MDSRHYQRYEELSHRKLLLRPAPQEMAEASPSRGRVSEFRKEKVEVTVALGFDLHPSVLISLTLDVERYALIF